MSEADLRAYYRRKRPLTLWSLGAGSLMACAIAAVSLNGAAATLTGTVCGVLNALLTMHVNERLLDHRSPLAFVFSSILRIAVFGIVPVAFAAHGPAWSLAVYFLGFFMPLALYGVLVRRALRTR